MTQKDISDHRDDEVNWERGRITRRRSKTRKYRNAPEVSYVLWKETLDLLIRERSRDDNLRYKVNRRSAVNSELVAQLPSQAAFHKFTISRAFPFLTHGISFTFEKP